jgi:hypothetical protein
LAPKASVANSSLEPTFESRRLRQKISLDDDLETALEYVSETIRKATKGIYQLSRRLIFWLMALLSVIYLLAKQIPVDGMKHTSTLFLNENAWTAIFWILATFSFLNLISLAVQIAILLNLLRAVRIRRRRLVFVQADLSSSELGNEFTR